MEAIYDFQPGHQLICQRQNRPKSDFGLLSYFDLNLQFSQFASAMIDPFIYDYNVENVTGN